MKKNRTGHNKCSLCHKSGHNKRTCGVALPRPATPPIRPPQDRHKFTESKSNTINKVNAHTNATSDIDEVLNVNPVVEAATNSPYSVEELEIWWEIKDGEHGKGITTDADGKRHTPWEYENTENLLEFVEEIATITPPVPPATWREFFNNFHSYAIEALLDEYQDGEVVTESVIRELFMNLSPNNLGQPKPLLPTQLFEALMTHPSNTVRTSLTSKAGIPVAVQEKMIPTASRTALWFLAENVHTPPHLLTKMNRIAEDELEHLLATGEQTDLIYDYQHLQVIIAAHPSTPQETLQHLILNPNVNVRKAVYGNPRCTKKLKQERYKFLTRRVEINQKIVEQLKNHNHNHPETAKPSKGNLVKTFRKIENYEKENKRIGAEMLLLTRYGGAPKPAIRAYVKQLLERAQKDVRKEVVTSMNSTTNVERLCQTIWYNNFTPQELTHIYREVKTWRQHEQRVLIFLLHKPNLPQPIIDECTQLIPDERVGDAFKAALNKALTKKKGGVKGG